MSTRHQINFNWKSSGRFDVELGESFFVRNARTCICINQQWISFDWDENFSEWQDYSDRIGKGRYQLIEGAVSEPQCKIKLHSVVYDDLPLMRLWLTIVNFSQKNIAIDDIHLVETADKEQGDFDLKQSSQDINVFMDSGSSHWAGVTPLYGKSVEYDEMWKEYCSPQTLQRFLSLTGLKSPGLGSHSSSSGLSVFVKDSGQGPALLVGFAPIQRAFSSIIFNSDKEKVNYFAAVSNLYQYELTPKAEYNSEELFIGSFANGFQALQQYSDSSVALRGIRVSDKKQPSGWMSWYGFRLEVSEDNILENAKIVSERFLPYGMNIIQPDYGWQENFICNEWRKANDNFPHGLKWLSEKLEKMGLEMGFWISPILISGLSDFAKNNKHFLVKDKNGQSKVVCNWPWGEHEEAFLIDPTLDGSFDDFKAQIDWFKENTTSRYWKLDFINTIIQYAYISKIGNPSVVPAVEAYRVLCKTLRNALGDDYFYGCSNFPYAEWGLSDSTMSSCDIGNPCFERDDTNDNAVYSVRGFCERVSTIVSRHFLHKKLTLLNPDAALLGNEATLDEARMRFSLVAFSGGQVFLGDNLCNYSEERLLMAEKGLPAYGKSATPVDMFTSAYPGYPHIWRLPIKTAWDTWDVFCISNIAQKEDLDIDISPFFDSMQDLVAFDFWEEKVLGALPSSCKFRLMPKQSKIILVRKSKKHPYLLATNMHYTQGAIEIEDCKWDDSKLVLELQLKRRPGANGKVWLHIPPAYTYKDHRANDSIIDLELNSHSVIVANVNFKNDTSWIKVRFDRS